MSTSLAASTVALATCAPDESFTTPEMVLCAAAIIANAMRRQTTKYARLIQCSFTLDVTAPTAISSEYIAKNCQSQWFWPRLVLVATGWRRGKRSSPFQKSDPGRRGRKLVFFGSYAGTLQRYFGSSCKTPKTIA